MNMLYVWNDSYCYGQEDTGYVLNSKYDIKFFREEMRLCINQNKDYMESFWGGRIFDVMAVVGENGAGKTRLANCIMDTLIWLEVYSKWKFWEQFIIVFEDEKNGKKCIKIFSTYDRRDISVERESACEWDWKYVSDDMEEFGRIQRELDGFKFGYFTNALSIIDYQRDRGKYVFDASLGGCIKKYFKSDLERTYGSVPKDKIINYFNYEFERMIDFAVSYWDTDTVSLEKPKYIDVILCDYQKNLQDIVSRFAKMENPPEIIAEFVKEKVLEKLCQNILKKYGESKLNRLIINLMLNLFRDLYFGLYEEQSNDEDLGFADKLKNIESSEYANIFVMMKDLLDKIETNRNKIEITNYRSFVNWLSEVSVFGKDDKNIRSDQWSLALREGEETVKELWMHYSNTNYAYPYLEFKFGLSTGEQNFLRLFSKIAELKKENDNNIKAANNIFLFFDEADLSLHPRWQQEYMEKLLSFIRKCFGRCEVQVIVATHSPIILSDFPRNNVIYFRNAEGRLAAEKRSAKTFGNNIHELFLDSFFLSDMGTMGAFAEKKINGLAGDLRHGGDMDQKHILQIINNVGDDIIRNKLMQMYNNKMHVKEEANPSAPVITDAMINLLKGQVKGLQNTIEELEKMKDDKNRFR